MSSFTVFILCLHSLFSGTGGKVAPAPSAAPRMTISREGNFVIGGGAIGSGIGGGGDSLGGGGGGGGIADADNNHDDNGDANNMSSFFATARDPSTMATSEKGVRVDP